MPNRLTGGMAKPLYVPANGVNIILIFSNSMPHPDMFWYCLNEMGTQKILHPKFCQTFSMQMLHKNLRR